MERTIDAPADALFDILTNPRRHAELDGSGFVRGDENGEALLEQVSFPLVGQHQLKTSLDRLAAAVSS